MYKDALLHLTNLKQKENASGKEIGNAEKNVSYWEGKLTKHVKRTPTSKGCYPAESKSFRLAPTAPITDEVLEDDIIDSFEIQDIHVSKAECGPDGSWTVYYREDCSIDIDAIDIYGNEYKITLEGGGSPLSMTSFYEMKGQEEDPAATGGQFVLYKVMTANFDRDLLTADNIQKALKLSKHKIMVSREQIEPAAEGAYWKVHCSVEESSKFPDSFEVRRIKLAKFASMEESETEDEATYQDQPRNGPAAPKNSRSKAPPAAAEPPVAGRIERSKSVVGRDTARRFLLENEVVDCAEYWLSFLQSFLQFELWRTSDEPTEHISREDALAAIEKLKARLEYENHYASSTIIQDAWEELHDGLPAHFAAVQKEHHSLSKSVAAIVLFYQNKLAAPLKASLEPAHQLLLAYQQFLEMKKAAGCGVFLTTLIQSIRTAVDQKGKWKDGQSYFDEISNFLEKYDNTREQYVTRMTNLLKSCQKCLDKIRPVNVTLLSHLLQQNQITAEDYLRDKDVFFLMGQSGAGKSTTIHFLRGSSFKKQIVIDAFGRVHYEPIASKKKGSSEVTQLFATSPYGVAETKTINGIEIEYQGKTYILIDSPGFGDSAGIEVDIANGFSIAKALRMCRSVKPLVIVSCDQGVRFYEQFARFCETVLDLLQDDGLIDQFTFLYTMAPKDEDKSKVIKKTLNSQILSQSDEYSVKLVVTAMKKRCSPALIVDLDDCEASREFILKTISSDQQVPKITNPSTAFKGFFRSDHKKNFLSYLSELEKSVELSFGQMDLPLLRHRIKQLLSLKEFMDFPACADSVQRTVTALHEHCVSAFHRVETTFKKIADHQPLSSDELKSLANEMNVIVSLDGIRLEYARAAMVEDFDYDLQQKLLEMTRAFLSDGVLTQVSKYCDSYPSGATELALPLRDLLLYCLQLRSAVQRLDGFAHSSCLDSIQNEILTALTGSLRQLLQKCVVDVIRHVEGSLVSSSGRETATEAVQWAKEIETLRLFCQQFSSSVFSLAVKEKIEVPDMVVEGYCEKSLEQTQKKFQAKQQELLREVTAVMKNEEAPPNAERVLVIFSIFDQLLEFYRRNEDEESLDSSTIQEKRTQLRESVMKRVLKHVDLIKKCLKDFDPMKHLKDFDLFLTIQRKTDTLVAFRGHPLLSEPIEKHLLTIRDALSAASRQIVNMVREEISKFPSEPLVINQEILSSGLVHLNHLRWHDSHGWEMIVDELFRIRDRAMARHHPTLYFNEEINQLARSTYHLFVLRNVFLAADLPVEGMDENRCATIGYLRERIEGESRPFVELLGTEVVALKRLFEQQVVGSEGSQVAANYDFGQRFFQFVSTFAVNEKYFPADEEFLRSLKDLEERSYLLLAHQFEQLSAQLDRRYSWMTQLWDLLQPGNSLPMSVEFEELYVTLVYCSFYRSTPFKKSFDAPMVLLHTWLLRLKDIYELMCKCVEEHPAFLDKCSDLIHRGLKIFDAFPQETSFAFASLLPKMKESQGQSSDDLEFAINCCDYQLVKQEISFYDRKDPKYLELTKLLVEEMRKHIAEVVTVLNVCQPRGEFYFTNTWKELKDLHLMETLFRDRIEIWRPMQSPFKSLLQGMETMTNAFLQSEKEVRSLLKNLDFFQLANYMQTLRRILDVQNCFDLLYLQKPSSSLSGIACCSHCSLLWKSSSSCAPNSFSLSCASSITTEDGEEFFSASAGPIAVESTSMDREVFCAECHEPIVVSFENIRHDLCSSTRIPLTCLNGHGNMVSSQSQLSSKIVQFFSRISDIETNVRNLTVTFLQKKITAIEKITEDDEEHEVTAKLPPKDIFERFELVATSELSIQRFFAHLEKKYVTTLRDVTQKFLSMARAADSFYNEGAAMTVPSFSEMKSIEKSLAILDALRKWLSQVRKDDLEVPNIKDLSAKFHAIAEEKQRRQKSKNLPELFANLHDARKAMDNSSTSQIHKEITRQAEEFLLLRSTVQTDLLGAVKGFERQFPDWFATKDVNGTFFDGFPEVISSLLEQTKALLDLRDRDVQCHHQTNLLLRFKDYRVVLAWLGLRAHPQWANIPLEQVLPMQLDPTLTLPSLLERCEGYFQDILKALVELCTGLRVQHDRFQSIVAHEKFSSSHQEVSDDDVKRFFEECAHYAKQYTELIHSLEPIAKLLQKEEFQQIFIPKDLMPLLSGLGEVASRRCLESKFLSPLTLSPNQEDRDSYYKLICFYSFLSLHAAAASVIGIKTEQLQAHFREEVHGIIKQCHTILGEKSIHFDLFHVHYANLIALSTCPSQFLQGLVRAPIDKLKEEVKTMIRTVKKRSDLTPSQWTRWQDQIIPIATLIVDMKVMSNKLLYFSKDIDQTIDQLLADYEKTNANGKSLVAEIGYYLQKGVQGGDGAGKMLIDEHAAFKVINTYFTNEEFQRLPYTQIVQLLQGNHIHPADLRQLYEEFYRVYWDKVELCAPRTRRHYVNDIKTEVFHHSQETNKVKVIIPIMAKVFAFWTVSSMSDDFDQATNDSKKYLTQPHPGQIFAIIRLLGLDSPQKKSAGKKSNSGGLWQGILEYLSPPEPVPLVVENHLAEIKTGEGKSIVLAVTSIVLALLGFSVDVACYSKYLTERDFQSFQSLFAEFRVETFINFGTFQSLCKRMLNTGSSLPISTLIEQEIVESNVVKGRAVSAAAAGGSKKKTRSNSIPSAPGKRHHILLIDEVDVFFDPKFYGGLYNEFATLKGKSLPAVAALIRFIWSLRGDTSNSETIWNKVITSAEYKQCQQCFHESWHFIVEEASKHMLIDVRSFDSHIGSYHVDKASNQICYLDDDGTYTANKVKGYKTTFAYLYERERNNLSDQAVENHLNILIHAGSFSYAEIPKMYCSVLGVTGTLDCLSSEQREILENEYQVRKRTYIPSVYHDNHKKFDWIPNSPSHLTIAATEREYFENIANLIKFGLSSGSVSSMKNEAIGEQKSSANSSNNRKGSVLVFFQDKNSLEGFRKSDFGTEFSDAYVLFAGMKDKNRDEAIRACVGEGKVAFLTREFGRGTDFKCRSDLINEMGGVLVIQTFLSDDISEEIQIQGRSGRQGRNGRYRLTLQTSDLEKVEIPQALIQDLTTNKTHATRFDTIRQFRSQYYSRAYAEKTQYLRVIRADHEASQLFLENLLTGNWTNVKIVLKDRNEMVYGLCASRTVILIDATGSMGTLLEKTKTRVKEMLQRTYQTLRDQGLCSNFEVQIVAYRNYSSRAKILQASTWESDPLRLEEFMNSIDNDGGQGNEAIEIGLWHVNQQAAKGKVTQVLLIGDAAPNTPEEVKHRRSCAKEDYWASCLPPIPTTHYQHELGQLRDQGIPVSAYYVGHVDKETIVSFGHIAKQTGGKSNRIDIESPEGADFLTNVVVTKVLNDIGMHSGGQQVANRLLDSYVAKFPFKYEGYV
jgi:hypothetical protein